MRVLKSLLVGAAALGAALSGGSAQMMGDAVVATVNDVPISTFDVEQRLRLMLISAGGEIPEEARPQFRQQALRELIEDELKRQEANEREIFITDEEVGEELTRIAASGGGSIQDLAVELRRSGVAIETLQEKIRADQAWQTLVRARYQGRVSVKDSEIDDMLSEMRAEKQANQYLLSEICLPVDNGQSRERVYQIGMQMLNQLQQGVPFQALAQRFSVCPSAARGGDLGWMRKAQIDEELVEVVDELAEGNISAPIEVEGGEMMKVVALRSKRSAAEKGDPSFELAYAGVPKGVYSRQEAIERLEKLPRTGPCEGNVLSEDLGREIGVTTFPMLPISEIRADFQDEVLTLRRGDLSDLLESTDAYHMVYVCEMDEGLGLPRRRMVESRLEADQFELLARRYLRDVERDSDVDIRIDLNGGQQDS